MNSKKGSAASFAKGVGAGMAAGAVLATVGRMVMHKNEHHISKGTSKAMRAVGDFVDGIQTMIK